MDLTYGGLALGAVHGAGGVGWVAEDHELRLLSDVPLQLLRVQQEPVLNSRGHDDGLSPRQRDHLRVGRPKRRRDDDLVAVATECEHCKDSYVLAGKLSLSNLKYLSLTSLVHTLLRAITTQHL